MESPMTAPLILGVPATAHREALLCETAGGGRVPMAWSDGKRWHIGAPGLSLLDARTVDAIALILAHPTDPEAGAMGLARLAWVAPVALGWAPQNGRWCYRPGAVDYRTRSVVCGRWTRRHIPALRDATSAAHAIGLVAVHLGLLERLELVEVSHGG